MQGMLAKAKPYTILILHKTPKRDEPGADLVIREHARRNFQLRRDGKLCVVCPIRDESDVAGIGIFVTSVDETRRLYEEDPAVKAGILTFEVHASRSFPGDALAK